MPERALLVLIGTKAQFIKTAPVLLELDARHVPYRLIYTGQHSETFDLLEAAFGTRPADEVLVPDFEAATHGRFLEWAVRFCWVVGGRLVDGTWRGSKWGLVHGDTASTLLSALALRLAGAKVGHIEAGLRSTRLLEPFPEELIRRAVSAVSSLHFAPDAHAAANLRAARGRIVDTGGNTLRDALSACLRRQPSPAVGGAGEPYAVVSMHRNENLSNNRTFNLLMGEVIEASRHIPIRFVLHPATRAKLRSSEWDERLRSTPGIRLLERMDYPDFVALLLHSRLLLTDGGSNQEEAAMLGLPTLLLRRATERPDGLGDNIELSGLDPVVIRAFVSLHAGRTWSPREIATASPSARLVEVLMQELEASGVEMPSSLRPEPR